MLNEQNQLLASIIASPEDNAPRLVYADWLEENNEEERAKFIRMQIKHPKFKLKYGKKQFRYTHNWYWACINREARPFGVEYATQGRRVSHEVINMMSNLPSVFQNYKVVVNRGFVDEVYCPTSDYIKYCHTVAKRHPVRTWKLTDFKPLESQVLKTFTVWNEYEMIIKFSPSRGEIPGSLFEFLMSVSRGRLSQGAKLFLNYEEHKEYLLYEDLEKALYLYANKGG